ncbi:MAG: hypothetical protein RL077_5109 [Verrucomicrobiota bacterium]
MLWRYTRRASRWASKASAQARARAKDGALIAVSCSMMGMSARRFFFSEENRASSAQGSGMAGRVR